MIKIIKIKDLTLGVLEKTCREYDKCYQCPLNKLNIPCSRMPIFDDEALEKKVELDIDANEDKETAKKAIRKRLFYNCREGICDKAFIYYCPICGVSTVENMNYCFGCGNKLEGNKSDQ